MIDSNADNFQQIATTATSEIVAFENTLRPSSFDEYIGQETVKSNLSTSIAAAKKRNDHMDHVLLHGAPGLGKTTLATIIASDLGVNIRVTSGPALEKPGDVASILSNLEEGDVFFIDEIHRLKPIVEEVLYTAMEDFGIDIILGKGPSARSMRINLPRFTLIGATTKLSMLSAPLRSRFGNIMKLQFYTDDEIAMIIERSADILGCKIGVEASQTLAKTSRQTPRIANRLLKRVRDYADIHNNSTIDPATIYSALSSLGIDELGLDNVDREILSILIDKFSGGPVGLNTLSAAISEEQATVEDIYEPFLIKLGFLERTSRGRVATKLAYNHMKSTYVN